MVDQTIDKGGNTGGARKDLLPLAKRSVRRHYRAPFLVAPADELKKQVGVAI